MASFHAKNMLQKSKKGRKQKLSFRFVPTPTRYRKFEKNRKKIQKIRKYHYGFISSQSRLEKAEIERK